jgi:hypothetical protein
MVRLFCWFILFAFGKLDLGANGLSPASLAFSENAEMIFLFSPALAGWQFDLNSLLRKSSILVVFRGLKLERNTEIGSKDNF